MLENFEIRSIGSVVTGVVDHVYLLGRHVKIRDGPMEAVRDVGSERGGIPTPCSSCVQRFFSELISVDHRLTSMDKRFSQSLHVESVIRQGDGCLMQSVSMLGMTRRVTGGPGKPHHRNPTGGQVRRKLQLLNVNNYLEEKKVGENLCSVSVRC